MLTSNVSYAFSLAGLCLVVACSGGASTTPDPSGTGAGSAPAENPPASDASGSSTSTSPAPPAPTTPKPTLPAAGCNLIDNTATAAPVQMLAASAPKPTGGAIADGTYRLTDVSLYTGTGGATGPLALDIKQTIAVHGATVDIAQEANGKAERVTEQLTLAGSSVSMTRTCPSAQPDRSGSYSVTGGSLVLFLLNDVNQTAAYTYSP